MLEDEIPDEATLNQQRELIARLIRKLVTDNVLIDISEADDNDRLLMAHPDHVVEEALE